MDYKNVIELFLSPVDHRTFKKVMDSPFPAKMIFSVKINVK